MVSNMHNQYFIIAKTLGIIALLFWCVKDVKAGLILHAFAFLLGAAFLFFAVMYELKEAFGKIFLIGEGILALVLVFLFPAAGIYYMSIAILDSIGLLCIGRYKRGIHIYLLGYLPIIFVYKRGLSVTIHWVILTFLILLYYQQKSVIASYCEIVDENFLAEYKLKCEMEKSNKHYRDELEKSRFNYENIMLEEKGRIAQALHDKLGHNINGSLYMLEAAKLLIDKKPGESKKILEEVIDRMRGSMDEIRIILRNERPDKNRMAILSLHSLCEECEEQYNIKTNLEIASGQEDIPEKVWEVILDNTFEAVTNSLKYANCTEIDIKIIVLGNVVRCTIRDNGEGAYKYEDGMGIAGMKKRVRDLKGYFDITSEIGFTINMILPLV